MDRKSLVVNATTKQKSEGILFWAKCPQVQFKYVINTDKDDGDDEIIVD